MSQQDVKFLLLWWHLFLNQVMHCSFTLVLWSQSLWARCHPHSSALSQEPVGQVRKKTGFKTGSLPGVYTSVIHVEVLNLLQILPYFAISEQIQSLICVWMFLAQLNEKKLLWKLTFNPNSICKTLHLQNGHCYILYWLIFYLKDTKEIQYK